jgi:hypothetical protein
VEYQKNNYLSSGRREKRPLHQLNATVPDGGLTAVLLGIGMLGLASIRRTLKA